MKLLQGLRERFENPSPELVVFFEVNNTSILFALDLVKDTVYNIVTFFSSYRVVNLVFQLF